MKNQLRIVFALVLCLFICQTNVDGQINKKGAAPVKAATSDVIAPAVVAPVAKTPIVKTPVAATPTVQSPAVTTPVVSAPVAKAPVAGKTPAAVVPPVSPSIAVAVDQNAINNTKSYAGMKMDVFTAKMKSQNYEQYVPVHVKGTHELYEPMGDMSFKSKITGDYVAIDGGVRGSDYYVMGVYKVIIIKNPDLQSIKKTFLDYAKQLTDLRAEFKYGEVSEVNGSDNSISAKTIPLWNSKCVSELDKFITAKQTGKAYQEYRDAGHTYSISIDCQSGAALIVVHITDLSVNSNKG